MDGFSAGAISAGILKTLISSASQSLGKKWYQKTSQSRDVSKRLERYVERIKNETSTLITYRPAPQFIDNAYVEPLVLDTVLSVKYIGPESFQSISEAVIKSSEEGLPSIEDAHITVSDDFSGRFLKNMKYISYSQMLKHLNLLVLAGPGFGKTTFLSFLCSRRMRQSKPRLPIFLNSRLLLKASVADNISAIYEEIGLEELKTKNSASSLSVYVDGLDELPKDRYRTICNEIGELRQKFPMLQLSVSCRSSAYNQELTFLKEISLVAFDQSRTEQFIKNWFAETDGHPSFKELIDQIRENSQLSELAAHPLLLSLICNAFIRYLNISRRQTTLFEQCIDSLLWKWDADRAVSRKTEFSGLDLEKKKWLHAKIAATFHLSRERWVNKVFLVEVLEKELSKFGIRENESEEVLKELCSHHGLLSKMTEDTYGFNHLTIQEFLASKWFSGEQRWKQLFTIEVLQDEWWENTIALCVASLSDATEALQSIMDFEKLGELERLRLAALCLKLDPIVSADLRDGIIRMILNLYHNGGAREHDAAIRMLLGVEDDWTRPKLFRSLGFQRITPELIQKLSRIHNSSRDRINTEGSYKERRGKKFNHWL